MAASYQYGGKQCLTVTQDLGLGGMKIKADSRLPEGGCLGIKLVLRDKTISLKGRVVNNRFLHDGQIVAGIQFVELSSEDYSSLENCLSTLEQRPRP
jgi:hypothetical protein